MVERRSWEEFTENKLLWWINRSLHLFGWAIVLELDNFGNVLEAYPARVKFRGFSEDIEEDGFKGISKYLSNNIKKLEKIKMFKKIVNLNNNQLFLYTIFTNR